MSESKSQIASRTARGGIQAEHDVVDKFNNWRCDEDAKRWLRNMNYDLSTIESVEARNIGGKSEKADVAVSVIVKSLKQGKDRRRIVESVENIQVKKVSNKHGSNQMERRQVDKYVIPWHIPADVVHTLKLFTGELPPDRPDTIDSERMYMEEVSEDEREQLRKFLCDNMVMIISDIVRGRGRYAVEWMIVIHEYNVDGVNQYDDILISINEAINYYVGDHTVSFPSSRRNGTQCGIRIGRVTMQRKGGDGATDLQFKSDPSKLIKDLKMLCVK